MSFFGFIDPFVSQFIDSGIIISRPNALSYEPSFYVLNMAPFVSLVSFSFIVSFKQTNMISSFFRKKGLLFFISNFFLLISMTTSSLLFYLFFFFCICFFSFFCNFFNLRRIILKIISFFCLLALILKLLPYKIKFFFLKFFLQPIDSLESFSDRFSGIKICLKIWLDNPFLGIGLGNIPSYCYKEFILGNKDMLYRYASMIKEKNFLKVFEPSNVLTELLASLGLFGLFSFFLFFLTIFESFLVAYKKNPVFSINLLCSIIVMISLLQINQGLLRTYIWVHLGIAFGLLENVCQDTPVIKERYFEGEFFEHSRYFFS